MGLRLPPQSVQKLGSKDYHDLHHNDDDDDDDDNNNNDKKAHILFIMCQVLFKAF